jgi:hypothetical protein
VPESASRPGRVAFILTLIVTVILSYVDLTSPRSLLRGVWNTVFPSASRGENMMDTVLEGLRIRR